MSGTLFTKVDECGLELPMLRFTELQLAHLEVLEKSRYLDGVRDFLVKENPDLASDDSLRKRLEVAYRYSLEIGFTKGPEITQFICYESFAPGFYRDVSVNLWLRKPGASVESRWSDLRQVFRHQDR